MRRRLVLFFLCLIACTAAATATAWARHRRRPAAPPTGALLYPLAAAPTISGNFGQYRSDHPHGGVDLWSFLQIGTPVFAAADGEIDYLKCSSTGYGRSLYEKLADGRTAVYGHLSGFAPKIDEVVRREQRRRGEYHVRLDLARRPIGVKRGEVIGYAGDAGTDVPHLHFEIRDRRGLALNPLLAGLPMRDTQPPVLAALYLEPLGANAWVNGTKNDLYLPCKKQDDHSFDCRAATISGGVGLSAYAYDLIDGSPRRLAPYELRLLVDDREVFHQRFDRFSYDDARIGDLIYLQRLIADRDEPFIRLFRRRGRIAFDVGDGIGDLSALAPGAHQARLLMADEHGNRSEGRFALEVRPPPVRRLEYRLADDHRPATSAAVLQNVVATWREDHLVVRASGGLVDGAAPFVTAFVVSQSQTTPVGPLQYLYDDGKTTIVAPLPEASSGEVRLRFRWARADGAPVEQVLAFPYLLATNGGRLTSDDGRAGLDIPRRALYGDCPVTIAREKLPTPNWLEPVGDAYRFSSACEPLRGDVVVRLTPPAEAGLDRVGVYLYDQGTWWFMASGASASVSLLGAFALLRDVWPPTIGELYVGQSPTRVLKIMVSDLGSGVIERGITVELDGAAQIFEYLPYKNQMLLRPDSPLASGKHRLSLKVVDRAGNTTAKTFSFEIR